MEKKNIDWENLDFGYRQTDKRFVANYKDGAWDEGTLTEDANIVLNECAGVLQYARKSSNLPPGSECIPYGRFCKKAGNACLSGR